MPRSRRRPIRSAAKRSRSRTIVVVVLVAIVLALVIAAFAEITAQSAAYRTSTNSGYGALASRVVDASNRTGSELAQLMTGAPTLTNGPVPRTARAQLQQGLDAAVAATAAEVAQSRQLVPPFPPDDVSVDFTQVMIERAQATVDLRSAIDGLLGMSPTPIAAGSAAPPAQPASEKPASERLQSVPATAAAMAAVGRRFQDADGLYRVLKARIRHHRLTIPLPASVWVPSPLATAPLGEAALAQAATALSDSAPLQALHRLVITAVGLTPPAVVTGSSSALGVGCQGTTSTVPGPTPTVLPPTSSVEAAVTVTNCGTVPETGITLTETLALADPPGTKLPPRPARGGTARVTLSVASGGSRALSLAPMAVAGGHLYSLTLSLAIPAGQTLPQGTSQQFLLEISP
jgi:hypothetical protein